MSDIAARRGALRQELRARRADLDGDEQAAASMAVMTRIARAPVLHHAALIAGYRGVRGEIDIDAALVLLAERGATVTVPRLIGEHLEFVRWSPEQPVRPGPFGIPEPAEGDTVALRSHDAVLTPLVAFDDAGNRLGQGGGFYDRALAACGEMRPVVIGVAHSFQRVDSIPTELWDVPLDAVITEDGAVEFRPGCLGPAI